jgi:hypothetical protein
LLEVAVVICVVYRPGFKRHISIGIYMLAAAFVNVTQYACIERFGFASKEYYYSYYYAETLLTILLFFVIIQFYQHVFAEMKVARYIQGAATLLLVGTALFSYLVVHENRAHLTNQFVVQVGENLYFVGVVLTYVLWGAILKLGETRTRLVHLVLALGIYFSANAGIYALRKLFPELESSVLHWLPPIIGTWLPLAWAYTLIKVPEEARFVVARLAVKAR